MYTTKIASLERYRLGLSIDASLGVGLQPPVAEKISIAIRPRWVVILRVIKYLSLSTQALAFVVTQIPGHVTGPSAFPQPR